ncbi:hypothetical protein F4X88_14270 [Candidatus Poribacteria bacterium]|nr:hypothetical protein [Candidatus Poribacteria bacterium]
MEFTLESIQLTTDDLADVAARRASAQEIYSPTAPRRPIAQFGWRDRWWLNHTAAQQVVINYWFFESHDEACTAADEGRFRLSAQTVPKLGGRDSIYQPPANDQHELGDIVWQAGANFLFVQQTIVVLVAEVGGQVPEETTLQIAQKISKKIQSALPSNR